MGARTSLIFCLVQYVVVILLTEANETTAGHSEVTNLKTKNKDPDNHREASSLDDRSSLLDNILQNYEKREFPSNDSPTEVQIGINVAKLTFQEADSSFKVAMYLVLQWKDPRLFFSSGLLARNSSHLRLLEDDVYRLWIPRFLLRCG